jgi:hypothetical protein
MKNLEHTIFEQIIFTYQDHTGYEEIEIFKETWYKTVILNMSLEKRNTIKEVHFVNPKHFLG